MPIDFTRNLIELRIDLTLFPILLAFYPANPAETLATNLPHLLGLAQRGMARENPPATRLAAAQLDVALDDLKDTLATRVLPGDLSGAGRDEVFRLFKEREA